MNRIQEFSWWHDNCSPEIFGSKCLLDIINTGPENKFYKQRYILIFRFQKKCFSRFVCLVPAVCTYFEKNSGDHFFYFVFGPQSIHRNTVKLQGLILVPGVWSRELYHPRKNMCDFVVMCVLPAPRGFCNSTGQARCPGKHVEKEFCLISNEYGICK